jgi:hypothetical protein
MDFQKIVNTAAAAKGVEVAEPEFQAQFKSLSKNVYEIPNILSEQQEELLKFIAPIPYKTSKEKGPVTNDHPVMVALRALIRQDYENNVFSKRISDLSARTLVVGSAAREIFKYNNKTNFDFYFHGSDGKDVERTILPLLEEILSITKSKIKGSKNLRSAFSRDSQEGDGQEIFNFYSNITSLFDHYQKLSKRGKIIKTTYEGQGVYNYLLFEDSFYNFDSQNLYKIFKTTGAKAGFGYMILPQEFFFPKLALNPFYFLTQDGKYTKMGYKEGYCNGYVHETKCWRLLADNMGFSFPEFNLLCEIKSRVGPFVTFSISKVHCALNEHRIIHLGKRFYCVHLLNILEHNLGLKNGVTKYSYFPVLAIEFHTAVNYFSAIKPASRTPENLISFIRHRMTGAALINRELLPEWNLLDEYVHAFALCVFLETTRKMDLFNEIVDNYKAGSVFTMSFFRQFLYFFLSRYSFIGKLIFNVLINNNFEERMIVYPDSKIEQNFTCEKKGQFSMKTKIMFNDSDPSDDCPICQKMKGKLGKQKVICEYKDHQTTISLTQTQIDWLRNQMTKDPNDNERMVDLKTEAMKHIPKQPFTYKTRVHYIYGPWGVGKTEFAKELLEPTKTAVFAPFKELLTDYEKCTTLSGEKKEFLFNTIQHKAFNVRGRKVLLFDEFTACAYENVASVIWLNQPDDVFFLGDHLQTCVKQPDEGTYIGNVLDLDSLSKHSLLVNFRNARDCVAIGNRSLGYYMECNSEVMRSIEIIDIDDIEDYRDNGKILCFSQESQNTYGTGEKSSVKGNQGQTVKSPNHVVLVCNKKDGISKNLSFVRVAMSRHRFDTKCYVALDKSANATRLRQLLTISDEEIEQYSITFEQNVGEKNDMFEKEAAEVLNQDEEVEEEPVEDILEDIREYMKNKVHYQQLKNFFQQMLEFKNNSKYTNLFNLIIKVAKVFGEFYFYYKTFKHFSFLFDFRRVLRFFLSHFYKIFRAKDIVADAIRHLMRYLGMASGLSFKMNGAIFSTFYQFLFNFLFKRFFPGHINFFSILYNVYNFKSVYIGNHLFSLLFYYYRLNINPFAGDKLQKFLESSESLVGMTELDNNFKDGYCWLNYFPKSWHKTLSLIFPPCLNTQILSLIVFVAKSQGCLNQFVNYKDGHVFPSSKRHSFKEIMVGLSNNTECFSAGRFLNNYNDFVSSFSKDGVFFEASASYDTKSFSISATKDGIFISSSHRLDLISRFFRNMCDKNFYNYYIDFSKTLKVFSSPFKLIIFCFYCVYNIISYDLSAGFESNLNKCIFILNKLDLDFSSLFSFFRQFNCFSFHCKLIFRLYCYYKQMCSGTIGNFRYASKIFYIFQKLKQYFYDFKKEIYDAINVFYVFDTEFTNEVVESEIKEDHVLPLGEKPTEDQTWTDFIEDLIAVPKFDYAYFFQQKKPMKIDRLEQSPADAYNYAVEYMPNPCLSVDNYALNQFYDSQVAGDFTSGKTSEAKLYPVNNNGNPLKMEEKVRRFAVGNGLYYSNKNTMQSIQVVQGRYVCKLPEYPETPSMKQLAHQVAQEFFDDCMKPFDVKTCEMEVNSLFSEFVRSVRGRHYSSKFMSSKDLANPRVVSFHLKSIFKAKISEVTKSAAQKVGQGISAWSALASNYFSLSGKIMNYAYFKSLKSNVIYDNRMTPEELIYKVNQLNKKINPHADNVVTDYTEYDKKQNAFTQEMEKQLWKLMGFSEYVIELYYSFRKNYLIFSKFMSALVKRAKPSGEPLTLVNNSQLNGQLTHFLVKGEGWFYIVIKGDDGWKRQLNLKVIYERLKLIQKYVNMDIKISFEEGIEFCGCLVTKAGLVPNLLRKLYKLLGHSFRDYKHFTEYQISLRDSLRVYNVIGINHLVDCNKKFLQCSRERVMNILYALQSYAHIDENQFMDSTREYVINYGYPTKRGMNI